MQMVLAGQAAPVLDGVSVVAPQALSSVAGVVTIDCGAAASLYNLTATENITSWVFSNPPAVGYRDIDVVFTQGAVTARTVATPASAASTAGGPWTAMTTLSSKEVLGIRVHSTGTVELFPSGVMA